MSAWLAGLIAADGYIDTQGKRVHISQSGSSGHDLIQEIRKMVNHRLSLTVGQPANGSPTYSISIPSPTMVADLQVRYGVTCRKTLTYRWPPLDTRLTSSFLRGYIDGDGCIGIYATPQGNPMLHLSFVGTPPFVSAAMKFIPADGRYRRIERCRALAEARYNGRHAWAAARWLFSDPSLYRAAKIRVFERYSALLGQRPPRWFIQSQQRKRAMDLLANGSTLRAAAAAGGVRIETVKVWLKRAKES
jgi:hypothetical protein